MYVADLQVSTLTKQRRKFPRLEVQCRARIHIGMRHYAGYIHHIGQGGARLRTISPVRKPGKVILRLPDRGDESEHGFLVVFKEEFSSSLDAWGYPKGHLRKMVLSLVPRTPKTITSDEIADKLYLHGKHAPHVFRKAVQRVLREYRQAEVITCKWNGNGHQLDWWLVH